MNLVDEYELKCKIKEYIKENLGLSIDLDYNCTGGAKLIVNLVLDGSEICKDWVYLDEIVGS